MAYEELDPEEQFLIRLPDDVADAISAALAEGKPGPSVEIEAIPREGEPSQRATQPCATLSCRRP
jgi:hypothetical protein